jgi:hypothetical protein
MAGGARTLLLAACATLIWAATARAQGPVSLAGADPFAVLAGTAVTNSGPSVVTGDLGVSPGMTVTGFPPGVVNGTIHLGDSVAARAQFDLASAYGNAGGQPATATIPAQLGGTVLPPGVYDSATGSFELAGTLTLDGQDDGNAVFIFKAASELTTAAGSQVQLIKSAQSCNVFWQVGDSATLGATAVLRGNLLALNAITAGSGGAVDGRLLARTDAVALDANTVTAPECDQRRPAVRIARVPKRCTSRNFKLRVRVGDELGVTTDVFVDKRRVKRSRKRSFKAPIPASRLSSGGHKIRVVSLDDANNRVVRRQRFERCVRGISFTG